jgi:hypothetical protein
MKQTLLYGALAGMLAGMLAATPALAGEINGTFNIVGLGNFSNTQITFAGNGSVLPGGSTGDFTVFGSCVGCITMTSPLVFSPFTPGLIYQGTNGGVSTTFTISSEITAPVVTATTLTVQDNGTATLTGFDPTPGEWIFSMNQVTGKIVGSFSSTTAVPEPISLALLGTGLLGLGFVRRSRT